MRFEYQHLDWRELANRMAAEGRMDELFRELMLAASGDVEAALDWLDQASQRFRQQLGFDPEEFWQRLEDNGFITGKPGERKLSRKGEQALRSSSLESVFGRLKRGPAGEHRLPDAGSGGEPTGEMRPWQPGDESRDIAYRESLLGAMRMARGLSEDDLQVVEREANTAAATVLLLDISHSMTLYGEDRITPAKRVALALAELQRRKYPRDSLHVLLFGDDVREVAVADLPYVSNGPYHTNTCEALRRAAEILGKKHQPNKRVVMITDGKPTALFTRQGLMINTVGLDPQIVTATLNQAARYPRLKIDLTVFMVASDPYLERFVARLVEVSRGRAFRASLGELGNEVLKRIYGRR